MVHEKQTIVSLDENSAYSFDEKMNAFHVRLWLRFHIDIGPFS